MAAPIIIEDFNLLSIVSMVFLIFSSMVFNLMIERFNNLKISITLMFNSKTNL
jgi:hypothetical protein